MSIKYYILSLFILCSIFSNAQTRQVQYGQQTWLDYLNQNRYSKRWGSWIDLQLKLTDNYFNSVLATESTLGATYYTKKKLE